MLPVELKTMQEEKLEVFMDISLRADQMTRGRSVVVRVVASKLGNRQHMSSLSLSPSNTPGPLVDW